MKKITRSSAFSLVKARNDQKKRDRDVEEGKREQTKKKVTQPSSDGSNIAEHSTNRNRNIMKTANVDQMPERIGNSKRKKGNKSGKATFVAQESLHASKRGDPFNKEVITANAMEVIEIPDEESRPSTAPDATVADRTKTDVIEIGDESDVIDVSDEDSSRKAKKRKKKKKEKTSKKDPSDKDGPVLVDESIGLSKPKQMKDKNEEQWPQEGDINTYGCSSYSIEKLNLDDPEIPLIAELDELCCLVVKDDVLLIMAHPCDLVIKGRGRFQCLAGSVRIMGYDLKTTHPAIDVYSPDSNSLLTMATTQCGSKSELNLVVERVKKADKNQGNMLQSVLLRKTSPIIVRVQRLKSQMCDLLTNHNLFFNLFETHPDCEINRLLERVGISVYGTSDNNYPLLYTGEGIQSVIWKWNSLLSESKNAAYVDSRNQPVILLCGAKNSGKSTTNRLLINNALNRFDGVYFLDCDIGQTEFTPPGCVSLFKVIDPVFGPPFTHQRTAECSYYFGGVSPSDDPNSYIECVKKCVQYYNDLMESAPLVVNTMGWIEDLGLQLLVDTVRLVEPSYLVQLQVKPKDKLPDDLYSQRSWTDMSNTVISKVKSSERCTTQMYIESVVDKNVRKSKYNAMELRTLSTLSHLSGSLEPGLSLYSVSPYRIRWKDVAVHICHKNVPRNQIMYALNASLVALCEADITKKTIQFNPSSTKFFIEAPTFKWKGYGIIRGIDPVEKMFIIVTPLSLEQLQSVNTIVKGSALLPEELLMDQDCNNIPYVDGRISSFGEKTLKRRRIPKMK